MGPGDAAGGAYEFGENGARAAGEERIMIRDEPLWGEPQGSEHGSEHDAGRDTEARHHEAYHEAMASVRHAIAQFAGLTDGEKAALRQELAELESISAKL